MVVYLEPTDRTDWQVERLIALVYLAIGLFVLLRRWTAPKSTHFFVFCLVSFILYAFKYTGILDGLDITILTGNIIATELQPALFLHFAISFTEEASRRRRKLLYPLIYLPGLVLGVLRYLSYTYWESTGALQLRLNKFDYAYLASFYILAAIVFWVRYRDGGAAAATPAVEVAVARNGADGDSLHGAVRDSVPVRRVYAERADAEWRCCR